MKCIIHLGPPKTGSTSIQAFIRLNKETLREHGILALASNGMPEKLPYLFKNDKALLKRFRRQRLPGDKKKIDRYRREADRHIRNNITKHDPDILFLSSEMFALLMDSELVRMKNYITALTPDIELVFYLRRPDFRVTSGYKNKVKNRGETNPVESSYKNIFDDGKTIKRLGKVFGRENITPVICEDSHPDRANADSHIDALLKILFRDKDMSDCDFVLPERRNTAWDYKAIYFMRAFNRMVTEHPDYEKYRAPLGGLLDQHFSGGEKMQISTSLAKAITGKYKRKWEYIRKHYFPNQDSLFQMDFSMYEQSRQPQGFEAEDAVMVALMLLEDDLNEQQKIQKKRAR